MLATTWDINDYRLGFFYNTTSGSWTTRLSPLSGCQTFLCGIDGNNIVGYYEGGVETSFLYNMTSETWTHFDFPWADSIEMHGIDGSNIVGSYVDSSNHRHGFFYEMTSEVWWDLDFPGAASTIMYGIDENNIVGYYYPTEYSGAVGCFYDMTSDTWTTLEMPGASNTYIHGIDGNNIVGSYWVGIEVHGFLYDGTNWTHLDFPAYGVDGSTIVGSNVIYIIPEPITLLLFALGGLTLRKRN